MDRAALSPAVKPLLFPRPEGKAGGGGTGKWTAVPREGGAEYVQALNGIEDVVSFYGFSSAVGPEIRSFNDMERLMMADHSLGFHSLRRSAILGVPVLWFEKTAIEKNQGSDRPGAPPGAKPRRAGQSLNVRTRGVFMLQKGPEPRFVTIACARTSTRGEIGAFFEGQFMAWLTSIIENCFR